MSQTTPHTYTTNIIIIFLVIIFFKNGFLEKQKRDEEKVKKEKIAKDWTTDTATEQSGLELSSDDTDKARDHNF